MLKRLTLAGTSATPSWSPQAGLCLRVLERTMLVIGEIGKWSREPTRTVWVAARASTVHLVGKARFPAD